MSPWLDRVTFPCWVMSPCLGRVMFPWFWSSWYGLWWGTLDCRGLSVLNKAESKDETSPKLGSWLKLCRGNDWEEHWAGGLTWNIWETCERKWLESMAGFKSGPALLLFSNKSALSFEYLFSSFCIDILSFSISSYIFDSQSSCLKSDENSWPFIRLLTPVECESSSRHVSRFVNKGSDLLPSDEPAISTLSLTSKFPNSALFLFTPLSQTISLLSLFTLELLSLRWGLGSLSDSVLK